MGKQLAQPEVRAAIASPFVRGGSTDGEGVLLEDTMHILICDDDAVFAARVETLVRDFFALRGLQVECTVCHSGEETLARRDLDLYQVALLDVDLDTMNGISLGKQLRQCSPEICLVYVSAYLEFAPEGYTVNAFRYILKRDLDCQLPYDSIYYLESDLRKINVYGDVAHQPLCSYYGKLNELPQALFENGFLRVGRSAVVNMKYIRQISSYMVTLRNGVKLGVSRNGYAEIRSTYLEWKGQFGDD